MWAHGLDESFKLPFNDLFPNGSTVKIARFVEALIVWIALAASLGIVSRERPFAAPACHKSP